MPVATATLGAAAGVAGGVILGRSALKRPKKVLGIALPGQKVGLAGVAKQVSEASKQFGKLAGDGKAALEKAEQISKVLG